ncbi:MAG: class I SAM-dependent methyltransferase [Betaproteobacteria bacterium]|nr:class I SAM-dependent methyltransferase [Betaproteobacteria bacterium]
MHFDSTDKHAHSVDVTPSAWVKRWSDLVPPGADVLDLACGAGRHSRCLASRGCRVWAVDVDVSRFSDVPAGVTLSQADLEADVWPLTGRDFDAVVVTNYLHRARFGELLDCVRPGGLLIYETFAVGNERFGRPANPDFLLRPGELRERVRGAFAILGFDEGEVAHPRPAVAQRICARRVGA